MDWQTIGTAVGGAVGAATATAAAIFKYAPKFTGDGSRGPSPMLSGQRPVKDWEDFFRSTMIEVVEGRIGKVMETQTELLRRILDAQAAQQETHNQMAQTLAVLSALQQREIRG